MRINIIVTSLLIAFGAYFRPQEAFAQQADADCEDAPYSIGFFNGVWNTELEARIASEHLGGILGNSYRNKPVTYRYFYNQTGSSHGRTFLEDIAEVFIERGRALDNILEERWELFWEALGKSSDKNSFFDRLSDRIGSISETFTGVIGGFYTEIVSKTASFISNFLSDPPTEEDYAKHDAGIKELAKTSNLLLIAHSQGNLFVEHAYSAAMTVTSPEHVKVYHVVPLGPYGSIRVCAKQVGFRRLGCLPPDSFPSGPVLGEITVNKGTFNKYRRAKLRGGDYINQSDVKVYPYSAPISFKMRR